MNHGEGPIPSRVMVVGEAWGAEEERLRRPFVGPSGFELGKMLKEAGLSREEVYVTNLVNLRPPQNDLFGEFRGNVAWICTKKNQVTKDHVPLLDKMVLPQVVDGYNSLNFEISHVKPNVIIAFGNSGLWALTGKWGIAKWRGSHLRGGQDAQGPKVIPTYHPAAVLRNWAWRSTCVQDLRRAATHQTSRDYAVPQWAFHLRPCFADVEDRLLKLRAILDGLVLWIDFDIETRAGHIACAGISWSLTDALCIPLMCVENKDGYWTLEEETQIVFLLYQVLTHPNVRVRGQNLLYDCQYTFKHWGWVPRVAQDTMISWHVGFAGLPKKLDFQASLLCDFYTQWKPDKIKEKEGG